MNYSFKQLFFYCGKKVLQNYLSPLSISPSIDR